MDTVDKSRVQTFISDSTELNLLGVPDETRKSIAESWSKPLVRAPEGAASYRFINYLTSTGLLDDRREVTGKGWRKFSYVECIYLNIVVALRKFGVKSEHIKPIYEMFSTPYDDPKKAGYMGLDWLDVLIAVHCGTEFELVVQEDSQVFLLDPPFMQLLGTDATQGSLRISLSAVVNKLRATNGMPPVKINSFFGKLPLKMAELDTVLAIRNLRHGQEALHIKRTSAGGTLLEQEKIEDVSGDFAEQLGRILDEDFMTVQAIKRDGKVVNVKKTGQTLYKD